MASTFGIEASVKVIINVKTQFNKQIGTNDIILRDKT
jgi:hypothetical protein